MTRSCPDCGADLEEALVVEERLSDLGYRHRDRTVECPECPRRVTFGIPLDTQDLTPPACEVCGGRTYPYKLDFHRVVSQVSPSGSGYPPETDREVRHVLGALDVHWKCEDCHYFENRGVEHLTADVYSLGVSHLEGRRETDA